MNRAVCSLIRMKLEVQKYRNISERNWSRMQQNMIILVHFSVIVLFACNYTFTYLSMEWLTLEKYAEHMYTFIARFTSEPFWFIENFEHLPSNLAVLKFFIEHGQAMIHLISWAVRMPCFELFLEQFLLLIQILSVWGYSWTHFVFPEEMHKVKHFDVVFIDIIYITL